MWDIHIASPKNGSFHGSWNVSQCPKIESSHVSAPGLAIPYQAFGLGILLAGTALSPRLVSPPPEQAMLPAMERQVLLRQKAMQMNRQQIIPGVLFSKACDDQDIIYKQKNSLSNFQFLKSQSLHFFLGGGGRGCLYLISFDIMKRVFDLFILLKLIQHFTHCKF